MPVEKGFPRHNGDMPPTFSTIPTLTDGVVTLRPPVEGDIEGVLEQCQDPITQTWASIPSPYTLDDAYIHVAHTMPRGWETGKEWAFVVEAPDGTGTPRFCGTISLRNLGEKRARLVFGAHPWARGRGVMERALRVLVEWGFGEQNLNTVEWLALRGNWPSWRTVWKLGFTYGGALPDWLTRQGRPADAWVATLRRGEEMSPRVPWLETPTLAGRLVTIRKLRESDLPRIVETLADPDTQNWLQRVRETAPHSLESDADFVIERLEEAASGRAAHWAVTDAHTDLYVGQVSLASVHHGQEAELSYWAHPHFRRRGWTTDACSLVVRHCFETVANGGMGLRRLEANSTATNESSMRVLERSGFLRVGRSRNSTLRGDGRWFDSHIYDQLLEDRDRSLW